MKGSLTVRFSHLLVALLFGIAPCCAAHAGTATLLDTHDVFNQLQQNVWYLPTADHAAKLYVTELGQGAPVVFLHGGPGGDFNYIIDALRPQLARHRFILFDQRGSLLSPVPPEAVGKLTMQQQVEDLESLRVALGSDKLVLFGHSFGTLLAMAYYQAHPQHVARLVLAGVLPPVMRPETSDAYDKAFAARQDALLVRPDMAQVLVEAGLPADPVADTPRQARIRLRIRYNDPLDIINLHRWREVTGGGVYYNRKASAAIAASMPSWDIRPVLAAHPVPITLIQGDRDYVDPAAQSWRALVRSGQVRLHVLRDAGHSAWIDRPQAFADALRDGLDRNAGVH